MNDSSALAPLYLAHIGALRRFLRSKLNCADTAAELANEVFVRLLASRGSAPENPRAYLLTVAQRLVIDHFRKRGDTRFATLDEVADQPCERPARSASPRRGRSWRACSPPSTCCRRNAGACSSTCVSTVPH